MFGLGVSEVDDRVYVQQCLDRVLFQEFNGSSMHARVHACVTLRGNACSHITRWYIACVLFSVVLAKSSL